MAVLVDTSNLIISNIAVMWKNRKSPEYAEVLRNNYTPEERKGKGREILKDTLRKMLLTSIRKYIRKFSKGYGDIYLCMDDRSKNYWRKIPSMGGFVEYKGNRDLPTHKVDEDPVPYKILVPIAIEILEELKQVLPYKFLLIHNCEGDDIIAVLAKHFALTVHENVMIVSEDKDLLQMQRYGRVEQYRPITDKAHNFTPDEALAHVATLIITGDRGDGIANIRSPLNIFVDIDPITYKQINRSPTISAKFKKIALSDGIDAAILTLPEAERVFAKERHEQNKQWIDLDGTTPTVLVDRILAESQVRTLGSNMAILGYLTQHKQMRTLQGHGEDFTIEESNNPFANRTGNEPLNDNLDDFWDEF